MKTISDVTARVAAGKITSEKLTEECLAKIAELNPKLNAFITVTADEALAQARAGRQGDRRRPPHRPAARHSDLAEGPDRSEGRADHRGIAGAQGSRRDRGCGRDAAPARSRRGVRRQDQPARVRVRHDQRGLGVRPGPQSARSDRARPAARAAGRRSAVATGMSLGTVGTDTGGSIRIPAAACGIVGLKPEWGHISAAGVVPLSRQLDHVGPARRIGRRCVAALQRDAAGSPSRSATRWTPRRSKGLRFGRLVRLLLRSARRRRRAPRARHDRTLLQQRGATVIEVSRAARRTTWPRSTCISCSATPPSITRARWRRGRRTTRRRSGCGSRWRATCSPKTTSARCAARR